MSKKTDAEETLKQVKEDIKAEKMGVIIVDRALFRKFKEQEGLAEFLFGTALGLGLALVLSL